MNIIKNKDINNTVANSYADRKTVVLFGIEAHVWILQTALELLDAGYKVYIIADAVSSIRIQDRATGIERMLIEGAKITTTEGVIFELMRNSKSKYFKPLTPIIRDFAKHLMAHI